MPPPYDPSQQYGQQPYGQQPYYGQPGQYPPPPPYGQPAPYMYVAPRPTNGMAIASMVLGILWIYWIGSVLALVFGYIARHQIRERQQGGDGMAIAGIVLGWIGVGVFALLMLLFFLGGVLDSTYHSDF